MTLTVPPDIEKMLDATAHERGNSPEQVALETLRKGLLPTAHVTNEDDGHEQERVNAIDRVQSGYFARILGPSSLAQNKAEEKIIEERRWR